MQEVQIRINLIYFAVACWREKKQMSEGNSEERVMFDFLLMVGNKIVVSFSFQEYVFESV